MEDDLEKLLFNYRARHYPHTLTRSEQIRWQKYCDQQISEKAPQFSQSINELFNQYHDDEEKVKLLEDLTAYAEQISQIQPISYTKENNTDLIDQLNKVAEQDCDKQQKLKVLRELI